jgi:hypothetical protein
MWPILPHARSPLFSVSFNFVFFSTVQYVPSDPFILAAEAAAGHVDRTQEIVPSLVNEWPSCTCTLSTRICYVGIPHLTHANIDSILQPLFAVGSSPPFRTYSLFQLPHFALLLLNVAVSSSTRLDADA